MIVTKWKPCRWRRPCVVLSGGGKGHGGWGRHRLLEYQFHHFRHNSELWSLFVVLSFSHLAVKEVVVVLILLLLIRGNLWTNSRAYIWTIERLLMIKGTDLIIERLLVQLLCSSRLRKCWTSRVASAWPADLIRIIIWTDRGRSMIIRTSLIMMIMRTSLAMRMRARWFWQK